MNGGGKEARGEAYPANDVLDVVACILDRCVEIVIELWVRINILEPLEVSNAWLTTCILAKLVRIIAPAGISASAQATDAL